MLLPGGVVARDHGPHAILESRQAHHRDVDEKKENKGNCHEEMNGAGRLLAAKDIHDDGKDGRDGRGHRETSDDYQWEKQEHNGEVSEPLEDVIAPGIFRRRPLQMHMIRDHSPDRFPAEIRLAWHQVLPKVAGEKPGEDVKQAGQNANPGGEKMEIPARAADWHI